MARPSTKTIQWKGVNIPIFQDANGMWRIRSRTKYLCVDVSLGTRSEQVARAKAKVVLDGGAAKPPVFASKSPAERLVELYLSTPKRTSNVVAESNVARFRRIVEVAHGVELSDFAIGRIEPGLWTSYQKVRLAEIGLELDYSRRIRVNISINAAVRAARCLFLRRIRPVYAAAGLNLPEDADVVTWLPEPVLSKPEANDSGLIEAWAGMERDALWWAIGLARFAGLRRSEILHCRGDWVRTDRNGGVVIDLCDRPEQNWQTKTGVPYSAPVIDAGFAAALKEIGPGEYVVNPGVSDRTRWIEREPQAWCRKWVGTVVIKPLHRLRALYAVDMEARTRDAVMAALAGTEAARAALGHTSAAVTKRHYLG
jgi:integrase